MTLRNVPSQCELLYHTIANKDSIEGRPVPLESSANNDRRYVVENANTNNVFDININDDDLDYDNRSPTEQKEEPVVLGAPPLQRPNTEPWDATTRTPVSRLPSWSIREAPHAPPVVPPRFTSGPVFPDPVSTREKEPKADQTTYHPQAWNPPTPTQPVGMDMYGDNGYPNRYDSHPSHRALSPPARHPTPPPPPPPPPKAKPTIDQTHYDGSGVEYGYRLRPEDLEKNEKSELLSRLRNLKKSGYVTSEPVSYNSSLDDIRYQHYLLTRECNRDKGLRLLREGLIMLVHMMELGNERFDPFGLHLRGFAKKVHEDIASYDDTLLDLHSKYVRKGAKVMPELSLCFQLGGRALIHHVAETYEDMDQTSNTQYADRPSAKLSSMADPTPNRAAPRRPAGPAGGLGFLSSLFGMGGGGRMAGPPPRRNVPVSFVPPVSRTNIKLNKPGAKRTTVVLPPPQQSSDDEEGSTDDDDASDDYEGN